METESVKLYTLNFKEIKAYFFSFLFVLGNIALPQIFHLMSLGGKIFLPIYFFTLIAAYKYGWKVGLLTAILSPLVNSALFGMPLLMFLPVVLGKSVLLSISAGFSAQYFKRISIPILLGVVLFYQFFGSFIEWAFVKDFNLAVYDFRIGIPGMLLQIFGGFFVIRFLIRK